MIDARIWRVALVLCSFLFVDCNCSEGLIGASPEPPQIDICFVPEPGQEEICYRQLKAARTQENCSENGECALPELNANLGKIPVNGSGELTFRVLNVGSAPLELYNINQAPGSSPRFRITPIPETNEADIYTVIEPGGEFQFQAQLSGGNCGAQAARWIITSNDAEIPRNTPMHLRNIQPDSPLYLNLSGMVSGPCLCPLTNATVSFGAVVVGHLETKRFSFESCGDEPLVIEDATIGQDPGAVFTVEQMVLPENSTLEPGEQGHIDIGYTPATVAPPSDAGEMWLVTNAPTAQPHFPVLLVGDGLERPSCKLGALPNTAGFGAVGSSVTRTFRLFNEGEIACRVYDMQHTSGSTEFSLSGTTFPPDVTLQPNESVEIQITYLPLDDSFDEATFTAYADDVYQIETTTVINVSGNPPTGEGCVLDVQPDYGDFGAVSLGQTTDVTFSIGNIGSSPGGIGGFFGGNCQLDNVYLLSGAPDFRLGDLGALTDFIGIPPGGIMDTSLTVYFEPQSEGIKNGILRIVSNDINGSIRDIPLWGNALGAKLCVGVDGQAPGSVTCGTTQPCDTLDFGTIASNDTSLQSVVLTNCGAGELMIRGIEMDPASDPQFVRTAPNQNLLPITLLPNQSTSMQVRYSPTDSAGDFGAVTILSNASGAEAARVDFRGNFTGDCEQILRCSPEFTYFGTVEAGIQSVKAVTCTNFGQETITISNVATSGSPRIELLTHNYGTLQPGDNVSLQMGCTPIVAGNLQSNFSVISDACDRSPFTLEMECNGIVNDPPDCIGSDTYLPVEKWRWTSSSNYPGFDDVWVTPIVMNLTDDNQDGVVDVLDTPDVIFTAIQSSLSFGPGGGNGGQEAFCHANDAQPAIVIAVSGDTGEELWAWGTPPVSGPGDPNARMMDSEAQLAAGDIDGDGLAEIIGVKYTYIPPPECEPTDFECCIKGKFAYGSLYALEHDGQFKWQSELWHLPQMTIENAGAPSLGDMDGDGFPEISFGNAVFNHQGNLLFEGVTTSSSTNGHGQGGAGHGPISVFVDLDGDGTNELVAGRTAFDAQGQVVWDRQDIGDGLSTIANLDADEDPEIILLTGGNDLYVLEHTGATKYGPMHISSGNVDDNGSEEGFIATNPAVGDFDGDGFPEIAIAATNQVHVYEHDLTPKWSNSISDQTGASGPTSFDFEGDGRAEVVYADEGSVYIWNGLDGSEKYRADRASRTIFDNPVIVDVDNDGHAEIILSMETPLGNVGMHGVIAYSNDKDNWVGTRRVWNQHGYHITNVSESGVIPAYEGRGWLEHNVYRSNVIRCE